MVLSEQAEWYRYHAAHVTATYFCHPYCHLYGINSGAGIRVSFLSAQKQQEACHPVVMGLPAAALVLPSRDSNIQPQATLYASAFHTQGPVMLFCYVLKVCHAYATTAPSCRSSSYKRVRGDPHCGEINQHALIQTPCNQPASHHCSHTRTTSPPN